ncbi:MAG TPA: pyrimidine dimer DNA glycosylase/endonuclease V [Steroidobacteraceae bacterium]|nr:pyrimidine dimer DNA glycosylase/endonuclease V [Steroidobacteraceae bacterium]
MRLWTLHPKYLDPMGLVALWREGLLARAVLRDQTTGYRHHPQLLRFRSHAAPRTAINAYLATVLLEAEGRGYSFDATKVGPVRGTVVLTATAGQLAHEWHRLLDKLERRNPGLHRRWVRIGNPEPNPIFRVVAGAVEPWERAGRPVRRRVSRG